jgi:Domain of unknown function (DUF4184)
MDHGDRAQVEQVLALANIAGGRPCQWPIWAGRRHPAWAARAGSRQGCGPGWPGRPGTLAGMPFTFLSHQAPVLALKLARPRWFDGTALAVGSMAPDFGYAFNGTGLAFDSHTIAAQLWFCLPVTLGIVWLVRRVIARPLAAHLPDAGRLRLRDYQRLAVARHPALVTITSALIGSLSHVFTDGFTHPDGWAVTRVELLQQPVLTLGEHPISLFKVLQYAGHVGGAALALWMLWVVGRDRRLVWWYPQGSAALRASAASGVLLWGSNVVAGVVAVVVGVSSVGDGLPAVIIRATAILFVGVLLGCLLARRWMFSGGLGRVSEVGG